MVDEASRPILSEGSSDTPPHRTLSLDKQPASQVNRAAPSFEISSESTPLLYRRDDDLSAYGGTETIPPSPSISDALYVDRVRRKLRRGVPWTLLCILLAIGSIVTILILAFFVPEVVKEYVKEATVFRPTSLSIESATPDGVKARVRGDVVLDANRIPKRSVRNLGRFVTWIGREVETGETEVEVYLPKYGNTLVGTASLPSMTLGIRNGHVNHVDFEAELMAGDMSSIQTVALDWLEGRLDRLQVHGRAILHLKSGLLALGQQTLSDSMTFAGHDFPTLPNAQITQFEVHDVDGEVGAMAIDVSLAALIDSPFTLNVPPLGFEVLVPNCSPGEPHISVAEVATKEFPVDSNNTTIINVFGIIRGLSDELTKTCPGKKRSPLDFLVKSYMHGMETTVYVRGLEVPSLNTPQWVVDILKSVTVPLPFTGNALDDLVKNFTMSDVHFSLPNPLVEPDSPESSPTVSALVKVLIGLPKGMDFHVDVPRVRATADVFYNGSMLGILHLDKWQRANSTVLEDTASSSDLLVEFAMDNAPLEVTDEDVLTDILQTLFFEGRSVTLDIHANVDAEISTRLGKFPIREMPAEGKVNVKPPYSGSLSELRPQVDSLEFGPTTESSLLLRTTLNMTNPTQYSASIPFVDFIVLYNATKVAHITARDLEITPGSNTGLSANLLWSPYDLDGPPAVRAGQELLSHYVSGLNTSVIVKSHEGSIPALPKLGRVLSKLGFEVKVPGIPAPGDQLGPGHGQTKFIQDATVLLSALQDALTTNPLLKSPLHIWSSTAEFTLSSPFSNTTMEITSVDGTAFYKHDEEIGTIDYNIPFSVPPGISKTPRLPVDMNLGGIGYDAVKKAVGGTLHLDTVAKVGVRVEEYNNTIVYRGKGIAAKIKL